MCVSVLTPPADGTGVQKGKMIMQTKVQVESIAPQFCVEMYVPHVETPVKFI